MWILLLEALAALTLLIGLVWWTMFSGRSRGERRAAPVDDGSGSKGGKDDNNITGDQPEGR
jgi:hypothetical protein